MDQDDQDRKGSRLGTDKNRNAKVLHIAKT